jgi:TRAP-type C4-dicarboxylate transport system substrate-binding protein
MILPALALATLAEAQDVPTLHIATLAPAGSPWDAHLRRIEAQVEGRSEGRLLVEIHRGTSEVENVREVRRGDRYQGGTATVGAWAEGAGLSELSILELPGLFETTAEADHVLDRVLWDPASAAFRRKGLILASWHENGWRSMATVDAPARAPADLLGVRMRAQESALHLEMYRAFGAVPVAKPFGEVQMALASGVVSGFDATPGHLVSSGLSSNIRHYTYTRHMYQPTAIVWSAKFYDGLPADLRAVLDEVRALAPEARATVRAHHLEALRAMPGLGITVTDLEFVEKQAWRAAGRAMHERYAASVEGGAVWLARVRDALGLLRR